MHATRPTISDVARVAGVAPMTVSRVLTGSARVKEATSDRVRKAISLLRYEPNELARELRSRPAAGFGLGMPGFSDVAAMQFADAVQRAAAAQDQPLTLLSFGENPGQQGSVVRRAAQRGLRRLIIIPGETGTSDLSSRDTEAVHVVVLGRAVAGVTVDTVTAQDRQGTRLAVRHLLQHGCRQVAFLQLPDEGAAAREKLEGYRDAMSFADLQCHELLLKEPAELDVALQGLAGDRPENTGIVVATFKSTLVLLRALKHVTPQLRGIRFISLEDSAEADLFYPSVTAIRQPVDGMSTLAVDLLLHGLEAEASVATGTSVSLPVELVLRGSCGCDA